MDNPIINEIFIEESKEILSNLETEIVKLEDNFDKDLFNSIFRYVHTLKGSSGVAGFDKVNNYTHQLENLMDKVRSGIIEVDEGVIDLLLKSIDLVKFFIFGSEDENETARLNDELLDKIFHYMQNDKQDDDKQDDSEDKEYVQIFDPEPDKKKELGNRYFRIRVSFNEDIFTTGIDPFILIENIYEIGSVILNKTNKRDIPVIDELDPERCYINWDLVVKTKHTKKEVEDIFIFVEEDNDILIDDITDQFLSEEEGTPFTEKRVGEILLNKGIITEAELGEILEDQGSINQKIGDLAVKKGFATEEEVKYAVDEQKKIKNIIQTETVRVDTTKLDNLMNLLGEIVIGQASISGIAGEIEGEHGDRLKNVMYGFDRITRQFQEQLMSIRMIPVGPTFEQFRRFVRDSAHAAGKDIILEIQGGETELDKTVIEKISDPLKHMIRNSIDHGIEEQEKRVSQGKDRKGKITLKAFHQEGSVFIEVADDGKGIDIEKIREKAIAKNLITAEEEPGENRLLSFLFLPGFSTADSVGELSGRGVGMDVVKTNIEDLRGIVEIDSEVGRGTVFRIKLPLTLAIIDGMLIRIGEHKYIVPLLGIVESTRPEKGAIKTIEGKGEVVSFRGEYVSLIRLYQQFGIIPEYENPWEAIVMIVESGGNKIALLLDELLGQHQIVIKSLDSSMINCRTVSGAAILGDGMVALIIDIHGLIGDIS